MGKSLRDKFLKNNNISYVNFLPEWLFAEKICKLNDIRAMPRKHTDDFYVLFIEREKDLKKHLILNEKDVFVDVGANVGSYSLQIAKQYNNKGVLIFAIDAHPETFTALCRNVKFNGFKNIRTVNKAVSDHRGVVYIYEHLSDGQLGHVYTGQFSITPRSRNDIPSKPIVCDTLDNILHGYNCNVMKMDIEGAEVKALRGADNVLKQLRKIIVEIHDENLFEVESILKKYHFRIEIIETGTIKHIIGSKSDD
jgi:FkbM family methyltransferase